MTIVVNHGDRTCYLQLFYALRDTLDIAPQARRRLFGDFSKRRSENDSQAWFIAPERYL